VIELILSLLFLLCIFLVATGPKSPEDKKDKDIGATDAPAPKTPDSPE
jgi:hypothetical protein